MGVQSSPHSGNLRLVIREAVADQDAETVGEVVTAVSARCDCPETAVIEQLDELEAAGLLYRDGSGSDAEVRLP